MRIIPPTEPSASDPTLDRSRPVVVLDPWPFEGDQLWLRGRLPFIDRNGQVFGHGNRSVRPGQGLGWLTDGRQCIVGREWIEANAPAEAER